MVEGIEHLCVQAERYALSNRKRFADVDVRACVVWSPDRVPSRVAELTVHWRVSSSARSGCGIDYRGERIGIEPLFRACHGHACDRIFAVYGYARHPVGVSRRVELDRARSICLEDAVTICDVGLAEYAERQPGVQEGSPGEGPASEDLPPN